MQCIKCKYSVYIQVNKQNKRNHALGYYFPSYKNHLNLNINLNLKKNKFLIKFNKRNLNSFNNKSLFLNNKHNNLNTNFCFEILNTNINRHISFSNRWRKNDKEESDIIDTSDMNQDSSHLEHSQYPQSIKEGDITLNSSKKRSIPRKYTRNILNVIIAQRTYNDGLRFIIKAYIAFFVLVFVIFFVFDWDILNKKSSIVSNEKIQHIGGSFEQCNIRFLLLRDKTKNLLNDDLEYKLFLYTLHQLISQNKINNESLNSIIYQANELLYPLGGFISISGSPKIYDDFSFEGRLFSNLNSSGHTINQRSPTIQKSTNSEKESTYISYNTLSNLKNILHYFTFHLNDSNKEFWIARSKQNFRLQDRYVIQRFHLQTINPNENIINKESNNFKMTTNEYGYTNHKNTITNNKLNDFNILHHEITVLGYIPTSKNPVASPLIIISRTTLPKSDSSEESITFEYVWKKKIPFLPRLFMTPFLSRIEKSNNGDEFYKDPLLKIEMFELFGKDTLQSQDLYTMMMSSYYYFTEHS